MLDWYGIEKGVDNMDYAGSPDEKTWKEWVAMKSRVAG